MSLRLDQLKRGKGITLAHVFSRSLPPHFAQENKEKIPEARVILDVILSKTQDHSHYTDHWDDPEAMMMMKMWMMLMKMMVDEVEEDEEETGESTHRF